MGLDEKKTMRKYIISKVLTVIIYSGKFAVPRCSGNSLKDLDFCH